MTSERSCPDCGQPLSCDEVDIGVGTMCGNWRCDNCGWDESKIDLVQQTQEALGDQG